MIYTICPIEYFNLFRNGQVPNLWRLVADNGRTALLVNYYCPSISCEILKKHALAPFGVN
jgi:hypothetical protein